MPPYTYGEVNGESILLPAESYARYQNVECPQFYPLFPFNRFALGQDDMGLFRAAFQTFWGPGHDWAPDHNWGGTGMIGLQEMLMQTPGDKIHLLPAWPKDWDVDFKLHAPRQTVVEGTVKNGKLCGLKVTPESRREDVVLPVEFNN